MSLVQIYVPSDSAKSTVYLLGEMAVTQFRDLNDNVPMFQRPYSNEISKLDKLERKLRNFEKLLHTYGVPFNISDETEFEPFEFEPLSSKLEEFENKLSTLISNEKSLLAQLEVLCEYRSVLIQSGKFLNDAINDRPSEFVLAADNKDEDSTKQDHLMIESESGLYFVVGVIERKKLNSFERVLWRALRGNIYMNSCEMPNHDFNPETNAMKNIFIVFCPGREACGKVKKICHALNCRLYDIHPSMAERDQIFGNTISRIDDINLIIFNTKQAIQTELALLANSLHHWLAHTRREASVFSMMNLFNYDAGRKCLIAEAWCPKSCIPEISKAFSRFQAESNPQIPPVFSVLDTTLQPPTHFLTDKYSLAFQEMTDAYGIPSYKEANPALFMYFSFPFLFSVMFGDIGHALILLIFSSFIIFFEDRLRFLETDEIGSMIFNGRYIIFLMGLFSSFAGFIYNDCFSLSLTIFPLSFTPSFDGSIFSKIPDYTYPLGLDPLWNHASNGLLFTNSYKMKQAIIFGVLHMSLGIVIGMSNSIFRRDYDSLIGLQFPQLIFLLSIFGYLCYLILFKWITAIDVSILNTFINMFLNRGAVEGPELFFGQTFIQKILLYTALLCVPWMFLYKPVHTFIRHNKLIRQGYDSTRRGSEDSISTNISESKKTKALASLPDGFGETLVHQSIHTIEFVLGTISNTASYLRLWALSLAHAQLSDVLWNMIIKNSFFHPIAAFFGFLLWFIFTVGVMVLMEGMSAFLHSLRLHWVEFNNKFFEGNGIKFEPFRLPR